MVIKGPSEHILVQTDKSIGKFIFLFYFLGFFIFVCVFKLCLKLARWQENGFTMNISRLMSLST